jgi:hypothetical protein
VQLTKYEACILTAWTGKLFTASFSDFHEFVEAKLQRPVYTHEFASKELNDEIKSAVQREAIKLFKSIEYLD